MRLDVFASSLSEFEDLSKHRVRQYGFQLTVRLVLGMPFPGFLLCFCLAA